MKFLVAMVPSLAAYGNSNSYFCNTYMNEVSNVSVGTHGQWPRACESLLPAAALPEAASTLVTKMEGGMLEPAYPYAAPTTCIPLCIHTTAFILYKHFSQPLMAIMASGAQEIMGQRC